MEAIVDDSDFEETVSLEVGEAEEVHRGIVHAHHQLQFLGLGRVEHVAVQGRCVAEYTLAQIEVIAWLIVVEVRVEA